MSDFQPLPPSPEPQDEIRALLLEIRRQNVMLKRYLYFLGVGLTLVLLFQLIQSGWITTLVNYAVIVVIVMVVMLTAPWWSQIVVRILERMPWSPKKKN